MKRKKIIYLGLILITNISFASCTSATPNGDNKQSNAVDTRVSTDTKETKAVKSENENNLESTKPEEVILSAKEVMVGGRIYHRNPKASVPKEKKAEYTMDSLGDAFIFEEAFTNQAVGLKAGDEVTVVDTITAVKYDEKEDLTSFEFKSTTTPAPHKIQFKGKYPDYKKGDKLSLKFRIQSLYKNNEEEFVDLNYNVQREAGELPSLKDYQ